MATPFFKVASVGPATLNVERTLLGGQAFRWYKDCTGIWHCALWGKWVRLKMTEDALMCTDSTIIPRLRDYFRLDMDISPLMCHWNEKCAHFRKVSADIQGIRLLRQDPVECLFTFICTSNNNISRITMMIDKMCAAFGEKVGQTPDEKVIYTFPTIERLSEDDVVQALREMGFGYRAKYIHGTAKMLYEEHGGQASDVLLQLRHRDYTEVREALMRFPGVGPKVADCVCLMSMDKVDISPVDTHVWSVATKYYGFGKAKTISLTPTIYKNIVNHFRHIFGPYAGWAHLYLFASDLRNAPASVKRLLEEETNETKLTKRK